MKVLGILAAAVALTACTAPLRPEGVRHLGNQHVLKSNYEVGKPLTVNVGDPMVKVQDYLVVFPLNSHAPLYLIALPFKESKVYRAAGHRE